MNSKVIKENGQLISTSKESGMQIWHYNRNAWAVFPKQTFAYMWGRVKK